MNRDPSTSVKRALRREVRFGCPVRKCGSPYLTYHHFDPPWHIEHHNDPARMIALCVQHHQIAEGGAFTVEDLRSLKRRPFLAEGSVRSRFDVWDQRRLVLFAGGNWFFEPPYVLSVRGQIVVGLTPPEGDQPGGLDLDVRTSEGQPVLTMQANDWNLDVIPDDLVCRPRGNTLSVKHADSGAELDIKFHSLDQVSLDRFLDRRCPTVNRTDLLDNIYDQDWPIAVAMLSGLIPWPAPVRLGHHRTFGNRMLYEASIFSGHGIQM